MPFPVQYLFGQPIGTTAGWVLGAAAIVFPSDADYTLTPAEAAHNALQVTGAISTTRKTIVPIAFGQPYTVQNLTTGGHAIEVIGPSGTGVTVPNGTTVQVLCDGTNYVSAGGGSPSASLTQTVYVNKAGNDLTGNGSFSNPFLTIQRGYTSITDATINKRYEISLGPGEYVDPFNIKPWVGIIGVDGGANGASPDGAMITEITAATNALGFDASWGASGFSVAWFAGLGFTNSQTFAQSTVPGAQPQLNFQHCAFNAGMVFTGPGTAGTDDILLQDCLSYGGVSVQGWNFLWLRHSAFLGGTIDIESVPGANEATKFLAQDSSIGATLSPTALQFVQQAGATQGATGDMSNSTVIGTLTLNGALTAYNANPDAIPLGAVSLLNGAPVPVARGGRWAAPGQQAYDPTWYAMTDVYWDPVAGNDANTGALGSPVLTWAEITRRYGSSTPIFNYGQSVTYHLLNAQPAGIDPVFLEPNLSNGATAVIDCRAAWTQAGAPFTAGAITGGYGYTGSAPSAGGTMMRLAGVPGYVVATVLLLNTTRNSYAFVDSVTGGVAQLTQPQTVASLTNPGAALNPTVDNDWATGDSITPFVMPNLNLKNWNPRGSDITAAGVASGGWIIGASISDVSGNGSSAYGVLCEAAVAVLSTCLLPTGLDVASTTGTFGETATYIVGCCMVEPVNVGPGGLVAFYGGVGQASDSLSSNAGNVLFLNNAALHGAIEFNNGVLEVESLFSDGEVFIEDGCNFAAAGPVWGSYTPSVYPGSTWWNFTGTFATNLLTSGNIFLGESSTGTVYNKDAMGVQFTPGFALTVTNLTAYNGMQDPLSGARYCNIGGVGSSVSDGWYAVTKIFLDPVNGLDTNNGTAQATPVKTMKEVVRRYGTPTPTLTHSLTITQLSTQPFSDAFVFNPTMLVSGDVFLWDGLTNATPVGAAFNPTSVTPKVQTASGSQLIIAGYPAGTVTGDIIKNITKGSYAIYDGPSGQVSQPLLLTGVPGEGISEDNTWATTDSLQVYEMLSAAFGNIEIYNPANGGHSLIQGVTFYSSTRLIRSRGGPLILWLCNPSAYVFDGSDGYYQLFSTSTPNPGSAFGLRLWGCWNDNGAFYRYCNISGGLYADDTNVMQLESVALDCDVVLDTADTPILFTGTNYFGSANALSLKALTVKGGSATIGSINDGAIVYGGALNVENGGALVNATGGTFANCLKMTTLQLDGVATGSSFNSAAAGNPFTAGVALTSANLDTGGGAGNPGLQNPRTGSRYAST